MDIEQSYDIWAEQYDININMTRDIEAKAIRDILKNYKFDNCLEIGCGTGKNTEFLLTKAKYITAVDLSDEMLTKAKQKINAFNVQFIKADILNDWTFATQKYDLVTFSLVLEHIKNLDDIFLKVSNVTNPNAYVYLGELHPFKQYTGTKARFETRYGQQILECYNHNISDFTSAAKLNGFDIMDISEFFDNEDRTIIPRILTLLLKKSRINKN